MKKYRRLVEKLEKKERMVISFSGGTDSILLAKGCKDAGIECIAATIVSPLIARRWIEDAVEIISRFHIKHFIIEKNLSKKIMENSRMRCYYCKKEDAKLLKKFAKKFGIDVIADGINASDKYIGKIAGDEEGIWHPLAEAGIYKEDVRNILKNMGIELWNKPPQSCLATRIPYGEEITEEKLKMIERGEEILLEYVDFVRLRWHGEIARIETFPYEMKKLIENRMEINKRLKDIGFKYIVLDMEGY